MSRSGDQHLWAIPGDPVPESAHRDTTSMLSHSCRPRGNRTSTNPKTHHNHYSAIASSAIDGLAPSVLLDDDDDEEVNQNHNKSSSYSTANVITTPTNNMDTSSRLPRRNRTPAQFFISAPSPSPSTSTDLPLSRVQSHSQSHTSGNLSRTPSRRTSMAFSSSLSVPTTPHFYAHSQAIAQEAGAAGGLHRRTSSSSSHSRASLNGLRTALQTYQVPPSEGLTTSPHTPPYRIEDGQADAPDTLPSTDSIPDLSLKSPLNAHLDQSHVGTMGIGLGQEMMDAVVEIHRVLYRGREDVPLRQAMGESSGPGWNEQEKEVKRVVDRWFEGDCVYDHPLVKLTSRSSLHSHFLLLHLLSTLYVPALSPSSILHHAKSLTSILRARLLGDEEMNDVEAASQGLSEIEKSKGKARAIGAEDARWLSLGGHDVEGDVRGKRWWRVWDIDVECLDIGGMECYDGYHQAMIDHTITLTLLPSLTNPPSISSAISTPASHLSSTAPDSPLLPLPLPIARPVSVPPSFPRRLLNSLAEEFGGLMKWDLRVRTVVEFNEVGKVTHLRDIIDLRDAIETFVPLARRVGWISRRLTGFVTSTLGSVAANLVVGTSRSVDAGSKRAIPVSAHGSAGGDGDGDKKVGLGSLSEKPMPPIGLGLDIPVPIARPDSDLNSNANSPGQVDSSGGRVVAPNSLGLEGLGSESITATSELMGEGWVAPDCDGDGEVLVG